MLTYEVTADVDATLRTQYLDWLQRHVAEILALPGFTGADVDEVLDPEEPDRMRVCMRYRLVDAEALDAYLRAHAPRLRAEGVALFGDRVRTQRRVMRSLDAFA